MWTFHSRKHRHYLLCESAEGAETYTSGTKYYAHKPPVKPSFTFLGNVTDIVDIISDFKQTFTVR